MPLTPSHDAKRDQEKHDSEATDEVRHHGNQTGNVAGVGPDEADSRSHDEHGDHRSQPVQNPSFGDDAEPTLMTGFRQSKRQVLVSSRDSRTAVAAILAGVLIFAGQAGELAFGNTLTRVWVALGVLGIAALVVAGKAPGSNPMWTTAFAASPSGKRERRDSNPRPPACAGGFAGRDDVSQSPRNRSIHAGFPG